MPSPATTRLLRATARPSFVYALRGREAYILPETNWQTSTASGVPDYTDGGPFNDMSFRFRAKIDTLQLYAYRRASMILVTVDGVDLPVVTLPTTLTWGWVTLATGLDATIEHEYIISAVRPSTSSFNFWVSVGTVGGTGITPAALAGRASYAYYGDSITNGAALAGTSSATAFPHLVSVNRGVICANRGISGSLVTGGSAQSGKVRTADITGLSPAPTNCVVLYGTNDLDSIVAGSLLLSDFQADYTTMLNSLVAGLPGCKFYCLGLLPRTDKTSGQTSPVSAAIAAAVSAVANANVAYTDAYTWITTGTDLADTKHPNASGNSKIATQLLALIGT